MIPHSPRAPLKREFPVHMVPDCVGLRIDVLCNLRSATPNPKLSDAMPEDGSLLGKTVADALWAQGGLLLGRSWFVFHRFVDIGFCVVFVGFDFRHGLQWLVGWSAFMQDEERLWPGKDSCRDKALCGKTFPACSCR